MSEVSLSSLARGLLNGRPIIDKSFSVREEVEFKLFSFLTEFGFESIEHLGV